MSAWIVNKEHIDVLVHALGARELLSMSPDDAGRVLWEENHRSVNNRYCESTPTPPYRYTFPPVAWTPDQLTKIVGCYDYQTCENCDWRATEAGEMVAQLMESLKREGADEDSAEAGTAPWGVCHCGQAHEEYAHEETA